MTESAAASESPLAFEDPHYREAVVDLLGAIAYGEISAFERLAEDAKLAPTLRGQGRARGDGQRRVRPRRAAAATGSPSSAPTRSPRWRRSASRSTCSTPHTAPSDWYEGLVKAYVGDGLAATSTARSRRTSTPDTRDLIVASLDGRRRTPQFVVDRVRAAIAADPRARRPAGAVGPPADGGGADPGAAGGRRARRAVRAAGRRRRPARPRPGRDRPDVHPAHRAARRADGRARPRLPEPSWSRSRPVSGRRRSPRARAATAICQTWRHQSMPGGAVDRSMPDVSARRA